MAITKKFNMTIVALSIASIASGCAMGGDPSAPGHTSDEMAAALPAATFLGASNQQELEQAPSQDAALLPSAPRVEVMPVAKLATTVMNENTNAFQELSIDAQNIEVTVITPTIHDSATTVRVGAKVVDGHNVGVGENVTVTGTFAADFLNENDANTTECVTDEDGVCVLMWTVPSAAFEMGGDLTMDIAALDLHTQVIVPVFPTPAALVISKPGMGLQLPTAPRNEGTSFDVPVYVETTGTTAGGYDIEVNYDPTKIQATAVSLGDCTGFGMPVHNMEQGANINGSLKLIGLNSGWNSNCAADERVHVVSVRFTVIDGAAEETVSSTAMTCNIRDLIDVNLTGLAHNKPCEFGDAMGTDTAGEVLIQAAE
jgi:hypothetical protein